MRIIGLRVIHKPNKPDEYLINAVLSDNSKIEIYLSNDFKTSKKVSKFRGYTFILFKSPIIPDLEIGQSSYSSEIFNFDEKSFNIDLTKFEKTVRYKEKRPVWLFKGPSNMGKSFIAEHCSLKSYETDMSDKLPDEIDADIIVIGNKYKYSIEDIKSKCIGNNEYILVEFSSIEENNKIKYLKYKKKYINLKEFI